MDLNTEPQELESHPPSKRAVLREIGFYFLRLGATGFGGPLAVVAQMERDLAGRWLASTEFSQTFTAIKTLPGPVAFQMVSFLGYQRGKTVNAGLPGALLAATTFVFPSMVLMMALAMTRSTWATWTWAASFLVGLQAAALGLIISSAIPLARSAKSTGEFQETAKWMFAFFGFVITLLKPSLEPVAIILCGLLSLTPSRTRFLATSLVLVPTALVGVSGWEIHGELLMTGLKSGTLVFGSGLAIVPLLGGEFVDRLQWLTHSEFLEALMFGQVTPGPIMITATYIGARVAGVTGGLVATFAIFAVPFVHMTTWFPRLWARVVANQQWRRFSFGAISAVIGAVIASVIKLLEPVVLTALEIEQITFDRPSVTLALWLFLTPLAFYLIVKRKRPAWAVVLGSGVVSLLALSWL